MKLNTTFNIVILISFAFLLIRSFFSFPIFSDENIYINMAKSVNEGLVPYKDFFYAHPPFQLFLFQPILLLDNFLAVKIFVTILSIGCAILVYLIGKEIFSEKSGFFAFLFLLIFPGFILMSNQAIGIPEALFFFLLGFYFLTKKDLPKSIIFLVIAIFTRYITILLIPFLIYYVYKYERKNLAQFVKYLSASVFLCGLIFTIIFGQNFLIDTIIYQTQANLSVDTNLANWIEQYLTLGFFTIFLCLTALIFSIIKKDYKLLSFAIFPLLYDAAVLFSLKTVIYHYFFLSLPFVFLAVGRVFEKSKDILIKLIIITIILFSIITNWTNLIFFFDKNNHEIFPILKNYVTENLDENDILFGESRTVNYLSFVTGRKIANNFFDSDPKFINFVGPNFVFSKVNEIKPEIIIIDNNNYFNIEVFDENYELEIQYNKHEYMNIDIFRRSSINN